jgi:hypothetical protein
MKELPFHLMRATLGRSWKAAYQTQWYGSQFGHQIWSDFTLAVGDYSGHVRWLAAVVQPS